MLTIENIEYSLSDFKNLYDIMRIVDPINKKVIYKSMQDEINEHNYCYGFWQINNFCTNCISMRAHLGNSTFVKLECRDDKVFMVTSTPVWYEGNNFILEFIKDISDKQYVGDRQEAQLKSMGKLIYEMNHKFVTDKLTNTYNRKYIDEALPADINLSLKKDQPLSVIMADIDLFSEVNENYGRSIGDRVLKDFAKVIKNYISKSIGWVGRYENGKFLIALKNTTVTEAYEISENIRRFLENNIFYYDGLNVRVTSSFGIHCLVEDSLDAKKIISVACRNLYEAKVLGRNKTVMSV